MCGSQGPVGVGVGVGVEMPVGVGVGVGVEQRHIAWVPAPSVDVGHELFLQKPP